MWPPAKRALLQSEWMMIGSWTKLWRVEMGRRDRGGWLTAEVDDGLGGGVEESLRRINEWPWQD